jgi:hypothetical protein
LNRGRTTNVLQARESETFNTYRNRKTRKSKERENCPKPTSHVWTQRKHKTGVQWFKQKTKEVIMPKKKNREVGDFTLKGNAEQSPELRAHIAKMRAKSDQRAQETKARRRAAEAELPLRRAQRAIEEVRRFEKSPEVPQGGQPDSFGDF